MQQMMGDLVDNPPDSLDLAPLDYFCSTKTKINTFEKINIYQKQTKVLDTINSNIGNEH